MSWSTRDNGDDHSGCKCGKRHQPCGCKLTTYGGRDMMHKMCQKHMSQCNSMNVENLNEFYAFKSKVMEEFYGKGHGRKVRY